MIQVGSRNNRRKSRMMMLEGKRLNNDALIAGLQPVKLFFTQKSYLSELNFTQDLNIPLFKIPYKTMKLWSKLEAPPGVVGKLKTIYIQIFFFYRQTQFYKFLASVKY